jgi:endonuclease/exonuclease/phosphatase (EEP) superfamily protein YafD
MLLVAIRRWHVSAELAGALTLAALLQTAFIALGYISENPAAVISSGLRPYGAAALVVVAILLALTRRWARAALFGLAALAVLGHLVMALHRQHASWAAALDKAGSRALTVISLNVYNRNVEDPARVASALAASGADILVLTEATRIKPAMPELRKHFPHAAGCIELTQNCETVILSVHPTSESSVRSIGPIFPNRFVSAKVMVGAEIITVVAAHLTKPYFDNHGWMEMWRLIDLLNAIPGPLLLAGDFNAAPWSPNIVTLLKHTELVPGPLPVATWPSVLGGFGLPIDHVFTRAPVVLDQLTPLADGLGSNHRGLLAKIRY